MILHAGAWLTGPVIGLGRRGLGLRALGLKTRAVAIHVSAFSFCDYIGVSGWMEFYLLETVDVWKGVKSHCFIYFVCFRSF